MSWGKARSRTDATWGIEGSQPLPWTHFNRWDCRSKAFLCLWCFDDDRDDLMKMRFSSLIQDNDSRIQDTTSRRSLVF